MVIIHRVLLLEVFNVLVDEAGLVISFSKSEDSGLSADFDHDFRLINSFLSNIRASSPACIDSTRYQV